MRNMTKRRRALMASSSSQHGRLPAGFREVEWLQGSGTQYCTTDIYPVYNNNNYTSIKGDITILDKNNSKFYVGTRWYQTYSGLSTEFEYSCNYAYVQRLPQNIYQGLFTIYYGHHNANNTSVDLSNNVFPTDVHYEINKNNLIVNQTTQSKYDDIQYSSTYPLLIGAYHSINPEITVRNTQTRIKSIYVYNIDTLLYELIPCYRKSDGKTGFMKLTVADGSTDFFPNEGTDEWIIGPVV